MSDTTGYCDTGEHDGCSGVLRAATGFHWWCACMCHEEPSPDAVTVANGGDRALAVWRNARNGGTS